MRGFKIYNGRGGGDVFIKRDGGGCDEYFKQLM